MSTYMKIQTFMYAYCVRVRVSVSCALKLLQSRPTNELDYTFRPPSHASLLNNRESKKAKQNKSENVDFLNSNRRPMG